MFQGRTSLNSCLDATDALLKFENDEALKLNEKYSDYMVQQRWEQAKRTVITINSMERSTIKEMLVIILMVIGSML